MRIKGRIHPPGAPGGRRIEPDDLNSAEIAVTNLGRRTQRNVDNPGPNYLPVLVEHEGGPVGTIDSTWKAPDGSLKMAAVIDDPDVQKQVLKGDLRGLSIGSALQHDPGKSAHERINQVFTEVSVCQVPRRAGCYIEHIATDGFDYKPCMTVATASEGKYPKSASCHPPLDSLLISPFAHFLVTFLVHFLVHVLSSLKMPIDIFIGILRELPL